MQNSLFKLILFIFYSILTLCLNSIYAYFILIIITSLLVLVSNIELKELLNYLLKIKYFYLLILLIPFNINILYFIIKITIIYITYICYIKTTSLFKRYNTLYNVLELFKLEGITLNILLFIPIFYDEFKNIKHISLKGIKYNVNKRIKTISTRFVGFERQKQVFNLEDLVYVFTIILFFIIIIYAG